MTQVKYLDSTCNCRGGLLCDIINSVVYLRVRHENISNNGHVTFQRCIDDSTLRLLLEIAIQKYYLVYKLMEFVLYILGSDRTTNFF